MCSILCYSGKSVDTTLVQYGKGIVEMQVYGCVLFYFTVVNMDTDGVQYGEGIREQVDICVLFYDTVVKLRILQ